MQDTKQGTEQDTKQGTEQDAKQDKEQRTAEPAGRSKPARPRNTARGGGSGPGRAAAAGTRRPGAGRSRAPRQDADQGAPPSSPVPSTTARPPDRGAGTDRRTNNGLGRYGEQVAARRLGADGLRILERNWRCSEGELDIIALDGETLAVCEVKTRSERSFQQPTEAIDGVKADRLRRLAERWLAERWPVHFAALAEGVNPPGAGPDATTSAGACRSDASPLESRASGTGPPGDEKPAEAVSGAGDRAAGRAVEDPDGVPWPAPPPPGGVRIDLVAVINRIKGAATVEHLRGVV